MDRAQLVRLVEEFTPLIQAVREREPTAYELAALATALHSYYGGVENAIKRCLVALDGHLPDGPAWHTLLLDQAANRAAARAPVIDAALCESLREYLAFRHVFGHAYSFDLEWDKMRSLVCGLPAVAARVDVALQAVAQRVS